MSNEIKMKHQSIIKDAQELSNIIYNKLAKEAFENSAKGQAQQHQHQHHQGMPLRQNNIMGNNSNQQNMNFHMKG